MDDSDFERILKEEGLYHLKDDMEKLREELLKRLGLSDLKDSPDELFDAMLELLKKSNKQLGDTKKELGEKILRSMRRQN